MSEYTYDIDKYTIGVDENGEDGIGMTVAKIENGELHFLGNCYGENARCIDLLIKENQSLKKENKILRENAENNYKVVDKVNWENQSLKKQLEEINKMIEKCGFVNIEQVMLNYCGLLTQQKEFMEYMNKTIEELECDDVGDEEMKGYLIQRIDTFKEILSKYKEIIGSKGDI